ncbi:transcriptional regulator, TetR family [Streptoalloteichus hindustanus]|uniref:Transcriptional regulator, TetR family n=1 Tax=Streptoalloteichus hindustanus TaxID=2017 RepID=A0A1M5MPU2_STRHI|nr:transcriptional regulator, TetR family [Streptoalloteichus hindustanus]
MRVVDAEGLDAASIPRIARELGATTGLVQTYFRSKDELLLFAFGHLQDLVRERVAAILSEDTDDSLDGRLLRVACVLASADEDAQDSEGRVWLAFLARAAFHPVLRERHLAGAAEIRDRFEEAFEWARTHGQVAGDLDARAAAVALGAFVDGIALQRALEPERVTKDVARRLLHDHLARIFTG